MGRVVGVCWTVRELTEEGAEVLRASVAGAWTLFSARARYAIRVDARSGGPLLEPSVRRVGPLPAPVRWSALREPLDAVATSGDGALGQGRAFPGLPELEIDPRCILWAIPEAMERWLADPKPGGLLVEDPRPHGWAEVANHLDQTVALRGLPPRLAPPRGSRAPAPGRGPLVACDRDLRFSERAALERLGPVYTVPAQQLPPWSPLTPEQPPRGACGVHLLLRLPSAAERPVDPRGVPEPLAVRWRGVREQVYRRLLVAALAAQHRALTAGQ